MTIALSPSGAYRYWAAGRPESVTRPEYHWRRAGLRELTNLGGKMTSLMLLATFLSSLLVCYGYRMTPRRLFMVTQATAGIRNVIPDELLIDFDDNKGNKVEFEDFENDLDEDIDDEDQAFDDDDDEEMIISFIDKNGGVFNGVSDGEGTMEDSDGNYMDDDSDDSDMDVDVPIIDIEPIRIENMNTKWCEDIEKIFITSVQKHKMYITKLRWFATRVELVLSSSIDNNPESVQPSAEILTKIHQDIYNELEIRENELQFISKYEFLVATPGIGEYLTTDRDFVTFKGFPVTVTTSEEYKKKTSFDGNVIGRDDSHVILSLKGRLIKIPRGIVASVKLPKSQYESTDYEMQKLK